jgi:hypothetical protein
MILSFLISSSAFAMVGAAQTALLGDTCLGGTDQTAATHAFLRLQAPAHANEPPRSGPAPLMSIGNGGSPVGYTRLKMDYVPCTSAKPRNYPGELRGPLKQWLLGKEVSKDLSVKATINPTGVSQTRHLLVLGRDSSKKGESWNTEIATNQQLTRYFLVDNSTMVSLEFAYVANSKYSAAMTGTILELVQKATALIEPTSTLITTENKKRFNDASTFVDQTISGLLATDVKEKTMLESRITNDSFANPLAQIVLYIPDANSTVRVRGGYQPVGMWIVTADDVVPALLGPVARNGLNLVAANLSAPTIMNFRVDDNQTLEQYLASRTSISAAKDAYLKADGKKGGDALCSAVAIEVGRLGLSPADVGGAVWAYAKTLEPAASSNLQTACRAIDRYPI